jgi:hypothetical protein
MAEADASAWVDSFDASDFVAAARQSRSGRAHRTYEVVWAMRAEVQNAKQPSSKSVAPHFALKPGRIFFERFTGGLKIRIFLLVSGVCLTSIRYNRSLD